MISNFRRAGGRHRKNSFASETPVTDGKHVLVHIANIGLCAYDLSGNQVWHTKLKSCPVYMEFGAGSSPVLHGDQIIFVHDNEESGFIAAFNVADGSELWRTARVPAKSKGPQTVPKSGWVTPFVWQNRLQTEIITLQLGVAISYDTGGNELWRFGGTTLARADSSFALGDDLILDRWRQTQCHVRHQARCC